MESEYMGWTVKEVSVKYKVHLGIKEVYICLICGMRW
jgi:hypothetical protein